MAKQSTPRLDELRRQREDLYEAEEKRQREQAKKPRSKQSGKRDKDSKQDS